MSEDPAAWAGVDALTLPLPDGRTVTWTTAHVTRPELRGATGIAGPAAFGSAYRQADLAQRLAGGRTVHVGEVAIEAMVLGDAGTARELVAAELGALADPAPRVRLLRHTVAAWLADNDGSQAVADALGVAPRTVSYRLRRAEELLGRPIAARRAELDVALRLHRVWTS